MQIAVTDDCTRKTGHGVQYRAQTGQAFYYFGFCEQRRQIFLEKVKATQSLSDSCRLPYALKAAFA